MIGITVDNQATQHTKLVPKQGFCNTAVPSDWTYSSVIYTGWVSLRPGCAVVCGNHG